MKLVGNKPKMILKAKNPSHEGGPFGRLIGRILEEDIKNRIKNGKLNDLNGELVPFEEKYRKTVSKQNQKTPDYILKSNDSVKPVDIKFNMFYSEKEQISKEVLEKALKLISGEDFKGKKIEDGFFITVNSQNNHEASKKKGYESKDVKYLEVNAKDKLKEYTPNLLKAIETMKKLDEKNSGEKIILDDYETLKSYGNRVMGMLIAVKSTGKPSSRLEDIKLNDDILKRADKVINVLMKDFLKYLDRKKLLGISKKDLLNSENLEEYAVQEFNKYQKA
ncbi:hypothetical protein FJZ53_05495 [Candidatus Woesearchaeota archaeon]|nr:hypothetical protein [Candidatus Woesearchaeota archaeon]